jgi:hypothetical protein
LRVSPLPPPSPEALRSLRVHEAVRDYPELRPLLGSLGVKAGESGDIVLGDLLPSDAPELPGLLEVMRWRACPPGSSLPEAVVDRGREEGG